MVRAKFLNASDREDLKSNVIEGEARMNSPCTVSSPKQGTKVSMVVNPVLSRDSGHPSLDTTINGARHRLFLSTSSNGLVFRQATAKQMGLQPVVRYTYSQLYNGGRIHYYLANLDSFRVGEVEFRNCLVTVVDELEHTDVLLESGQSNPAGADGALGVVFLEDFLVQVDTPARQLGLTPLPPAAAKTDSAGLPTWSNVASSDVESRCPV